MQFEAHVCLYLEAFILLQGQQRLNNGKGRTLTATDPGNTGVQQSPPKSSTLLALPVTQLRTLTLSLEALPGNARIGAGSVCMRTHECMCTRPVCMYVLCAVTETVLSHP